MTVLLGLVVLFAADDSKGVPKNLKGDWKIDGVTAGQEQVSVTLGSCNESALKIKDDSAEWNSIPLFVEKEGKAKLTAKGKGNEGTLELKIGDKVYKGLYRILDEKTTKRTNLYILLGPEGKPAPKAFSEPIFFVPKDGKIMISCSRKK